MNKPVPYRNVQRWLAAAALALLASSKAAADDAAPITIETRETALAATLDMEFTDALQHGVNGAVLLEQDGKVVLRAGYGYANRERKLPFTTHTIAQIGSITKQFTAIAVIDLVNAGKLELSKPVKTWLPETAEPAASVTLEQLLLHTSGMPDECGDDFDRVSKQAFLSKCAATALAFPAGSKFSYSNAEYTLLAMIVEKVSGESIEAYLKDHFFKPIGMTETGYAFPGIDRGRFAVGYKDGKSQGVIDQSFAPLGEDFWNLKGNGGMQATTEDMYRWYQALEGRIPGVPAADSAVVRRGYYHREDDIWEGYGWAIRKAPNGDVVQISHSGSDETFFSYFCWRPQDATFFYLVSNTGQEAATALVKRFLVSVRDAGKMPMTDFKR